MAHQTGGASRTDRERKRIGRRGDSGSASAVEGWVLRAGALAAAVASIAGIAALVWPKSPDAPRRTAGRLDKVVVDANISLREFSQRQQLAATATDPRDNIPSAGRGAVVLAAQTTDPEPGAAGTEPAPLSTTEQPPPETETAPEDTPETGDTPPETGEEPEVPAQQQPEVAGELDQRLPPSELPAGCEYSEREGRIELACTTTEALSWADDDPAAGDVAGTRVADAQRVLRVLRGTRTRAGNEPVGVSVNFTLTLEGLEGARADVRWSLYDGRGGGRVPRDWLVNRRALTTEPKADSDTASGSFWVPLPRRPGPFFVRVSIFGPGDRQLDFADSKRFR